MKKIIYRNIDFYIFISYLLIIIFGLINIFSVSEEIAKKQFFWFISSFLLIFLIFFLKTIYYKNKSHILYLLSIILLLGLFFFGKTINGCKSWYSMGFISFQPSEFTKISISLILSRILSNPNISLKDKNTISVILSIILIPIFLILLQPDLGSVLTFFSFILVFYREGMSLVFLFKIFSFIILFLLSIYFSRSIIISLSILSFFIYYFYIINKKNLLVIIKNFFLFIFIIFFSIISPIIFKKILKKHQRDRIEILFQNEFNNKYRNNIGYNILYSKTAIGSGGFFGKGFKKGNITKGKFVPEQHTDYIFCTVGEEWGFIGSVIIITVYLLFISRIYFLAENQKKSFSRIFGYCVASIFLLHIIINLGMVTGIIPTIGVPLPFFSYGGSSLWSFTSLLFIFLRLNMENLK